MDTKPIDEGGEERSNAAAPNTLPSMMRFIFGGTFIGIVMLLLGIQLPGTYSVCLGVAGIWWIIRFFKRRAVWVTLVLWICVSIVGVVSEVAMRGLATLATNGVYSFDNEGVRGYFYAQNFLIFGVLWLLFGIPYRGFKYELDRDGEGSLRDVMLGTLAVAASLLTSTFILLLHYGNGPFSKISLWPLIIGCIFTVCLTIPLYQTIAKACWQRGILGILSPSPLIERWRQAAVELDAIVSQRSGKRF